MEKDSGKAFDMYLFKRVLAFTRPYPITFLGTALAAILLTIFSILTPLILKEIIDGIDAMPRNLNLEGQARFAIGYYHQRKALFDRVSKTDSENDTKE